VLLPVALEARSELVGVHDSLGYEGALPGTTQASWCSSALAADAKSFRAPAILFAAAKQPADVDDREGIVRPIASLTRSP
jgi:type IV secretory pathway TrbL component